MLLLRTPRCKLWIMQASSGTGLAMTKAKKEEAKAPALQSSQLGALKNWVALRRAVRGDEAGLANDGRAAGGAEAGGLEIRPGLLRAVAADRAEIEAVALGERLRGRSFDGRGKAGQ